MKNKNKKTTTTTREKTPTNTKAFHVHTDAVERLVTANETAPAITKEELKKYNQAKKPLPTFLKALFIKFWFNGAVCFFFFWGLALFINDFLDMFLVIGIAMGIMTDLLVNNLLRHFDSDNNYLKWTMFPKKKYWTFFANIIYAFVILYFVVLAYTGGNLALIFITERENFVFIGVEPILFGILYLLFDMIFIALKLFILRLISDANKKLSNAEKTKKDD